MTEFSLDDLAKVTSEFNSKLSEIATERNKLGDWMDKEGGGSNRDHLSRSHEAYKKMNREIEIRNEQLDRLYSAFPGLKELTENYQKRTTTSEA